MSAPTQAFSSGEGVEKKPSAFSGWMRGTRFVQTIGFLIKPVGANSVRPLPSQTNFCRKHGCTECPPYEFVQKRTNPSLPCVRGSPKRAQSSFGGSRKGGGEPASRREFPLLKEMLLSHKRGRSTVALIPLDNPHFLCYYYNRVLC